MIVNVMEYLIALIKNVLIVMIQFTKFNRKPHLVEAIANAEDQIDVGKKNAKIVMLQILRL